jgi:transcriptional regulator with XRE-family HTH domain
MTTDDPGKPVIIGSDVVGELFATLENSDEVVAALRKRMEYAGLSFSTVEQIAGLAEGAVGKYLSPLQVRSLTVASLLRITQVLGVKMTMIVDEALTRRMRRRWVQRDGKRVHANRQVSLGQAQLRRVLKPVAAELGRRGGVARMKTTTLEERREIGRLGAQVRWGHREVRREQPSR